MKAPDISKPNPMLMDHSKMDHAMMNDGSIQTMDHSKMDHSKVDHSMMGMSMATKTTTDYKELRATQSTKLPPENPVREVVLELTGNMERYIWSFNNKTLKYFLTWCGADGYWRCQTR